MSGAPNSIGPRRTLGGPLALGLTPPTIMNSTCSSLRTSNSRLRSNTAIYFFESADSGTARTLAMAFMKFSTAFNRWVGGAFTLTHRAYDALRTTILHIRKPYGDADKFAPSLYAKCGGRGRKKAE